MSTVARPAPFAPRPSEDAPRFSDVRQITTARGITTFAATETASGRPVLIKTPSEGSAPLADEALQREAGVLARVGAHPNIHALAYMTTSAGRIALVFTWCPRSLEDRVLTAPWTAEQAAALGLRLAGAVDAVHRAGIVHCAVSPANVLLTGHGEPVLTGFDAAIDQQNTGGTVLAHVTEYTPPELLLGERARPASDMYGLGAVIYRTLTGHGPHRSYEQESPAALALRVLAGGVAPVVAPGVPLELSDLLMWLLNPNAAERPPSAAFVVEELRRIARRHTWLDGPG